MTYDQVLNRLASLCSKSEKSPQEIYSKALASGLSLGEAERLVAFLKQEDYLSEERYAAAFVSDKFRFEHWGRIKIAYALRGKGIDDSAISTALEEKIDEEEYLETCNDLLQQRARGMNRPFSQPDRVRIYRFLAQRGFESEIISQALSRLR